MCSVGKNVGVGVDADNILQMNAMKVDEGTGISLENDGTQGLFKLLDPLWDMAAGARS